MATHESAAVGVFVEWVPDLDPLGFSRSSILLDNFNGPHLRLGVEEEFAMVRWLWSKQIPEIRGLPL